jgi:hypothetical protein
VISVEKAYHKKLFAVEFANACLEPANFMVKKMQPSPWQMLTWFAA